MRPTSTQPSGLQSIDRRMMLILRRKGGLTMEGLAALTGVEWERVFFSVDRLSRMGKVSLTLVRPCEYRVAVTEPVHGGAPVPPRRRASALSVH